MKRIFFILGTALIVLLAFITIVLSTIGYKTKKFNSTISDKINENNKNIILRLDQIKFKFDFKKISLFLETSNPELVYQSLNIPIENIKVYLDFTSLIKSKPKIDKVNINSKAISVDQLKKIILKTKPSNLNSLIINKVKNGKLTTNLELFFDEKFKVKDFIATGEVTGMYASLNNELSLEETSFNFFADSTDILIKNIESKTNGLIIKEGSLRIAKNDSIIINSNFLSDVKINKKNIKNYSSQLNNNNYLNDNINFKGTFNHNLNITFDSTYKLIDYTYESKANLNEFKLKFSKPIKIDIINDNINNLILKNTKLDIRYSSDKKNYVSAEGSYGYNNFDFQSFNFKNNFIDEISNIVVNFNFSEKISIDLINYEKKVDKVAKIYSKFKIDKNFINLEKLDYKENKNLITVDGLKFKKNNVTSIKKIKIKTYNNDNLNNDFSVIFNKKINIIGKKYDATYLSKILQKKNDENILKKISKNVEIDLEDITTPLKKNLKNFKLIGFLQKGKFIKISSKGDFGNNKFLDITLKSDKQNKKKYLEIYSDLPQALLSEYSFFKGLTGGTLIFSSIIEKNQSNSRLIIDNFKIINAPGVVKLLSLADFGGLADIAEGDGLSFDKLEVNMSKKKNLITLDELYAVGPSISVLMDGYTDFNGLTSLRGTLVPAKNLNKLLSKIPLIGNIIIPKEIGEGLFGVSFKMKGMPGKIKTTINPIKTLTPRFITKALEKTKKSK